MEIQNPPSNLGKTLTEQIEELKNNLNKEFEEDFDLDNFLPNDNRYECIADWWLSKIPEILSLIRGEVKLLENKHRYLNEAYKAGYNHCLEEVVEKLK